MPPPVSTLSADEFARQIAGPPTEPLHYVGPAYLGQIPEEERVSV